jgi:hypothetical protein
MLPDVCLIFVFVFLACFVRVHSKYQAVSSCGCLFFDRWVWCAIVDWQDADVFWINTLTDDMRDDDPCELRGGILADDVWGLSLGLDFSLSGILFPNWTVLFSIFMTSTHLLNFPPTDGTRQDASNHFPDCDEFLAPNGRLACFFVLSVVF